MKEPSNVFQFVHLDIMDMPKCAIKIAHRLLPWCLLMTQRIYANKIVHKALMGINFHSNASKFALFLKAPSLMTVLDAANQSASKLEHMLIPPLANVLESAHRYQPYSEITKFV